MSLKKYNIHANLTADELKLIREKVQELRSMGAIQISASNVVASIMLAVVVDPAIEKRVKKHIKDRMQF